MRSAEEYNAAEAVNQMGLLLLNIFVCKALLSNDKSLCLPSQSCILDELEDITYLFN